MQAGSRKIGGNLCEVKNVRRTSGQEFFDGFEIEFKEEKSYIENLRYKAIFTGSIPSRQIIEFDFGNGIIEQNNDKQIFCYYGYNREYFSEKRVSSLIE